MGPLATPTPKAAVTALSPSIARVKVALHSFVELPSVWTPAAF